MTAADPLTVAGDLRDTADQLNAWVDTRPRDDLSRDAAAAVNRLRWLAGRIEKETEK